MTSRPAGVALSLVVASATLAGAIHVASSSPSPMRGARPAATSSGAGIIATPQPRVRAWVPPAIKLPPLAVPAPRERPDRPPPVLDPRPAPAPAPGAADPTPVPAPGPVPQPIPAPPTPDPPAEPADPIAGEG